MTLTPGEEKQAPPGPPRSVVVEPSAPTTNPQARTSPKPTAAPLLDPAPRRAALPRSAAERARPTAPTPPPSQPPNGPPHDDATNVPASREHGGPIQIVVAAEALRRVSRTRQVVSLVSQMIIRSYEEEALHAETCRFLVTFGGYLMAWVGLAETTPARRIRPIAHAGLEPNFLSALQISWANDISDRSPTSRAIREQRPQVLRRVPTAAVPGDVGGPTLVGHTAVCALPLQFGLHGTGVLTIHSSEPEAFGAEELALLRELANDLAAGVIGLRERANRLVLEERLAAVMDAADDAIVGKDPKGIVSDWNQGAARLFGYTREEAIGQSIESLIVPPERLQQHAHVRAAVSRGERVPRFLTIRRRKDGQLIHTSATVSPITAADGTLVGSTLVEHDVTAIKRADDARQVRILEEAEVTRLKGMENLRRTFMSEASHELNTPLTPLRIHVETMRDSDELTPALREHIVVIERNVLRLCNLVRDMLEASRLETGRFKLEMEELPLAVLIEDATLVVSETAKLAGVRLASGDLARIVVSADRHRLGQVLNNLLTNAISFTPRGGQVSVSLAVQQGHASVCVRDTGVGLSQDQIGQLFQPFSRPHEGTGTAPKGTGLGLFISKGIIEQHGGRIWAESAGTGCGAAFCITLPLSVRQGGVVDRPQDATPPGQRAAAILRPSHPIARSD